MVELGSVSFIGSLVSPLICTGGWSGGVQQVALVHMFFVGKFRGWRDGRGAVKFTSQVDFAFISRVLVYWDCGFAWSAKMNVDFSCVLFNNHREWAGEVLLRRSDASFFRKLFFDSL